jgi:UDP-2-acetamido-3-amino-2,3-dideoxy-glucuronate N-acetyltransferase
MTSGYQAHPSAMIDEGAQIGAGTRIWHWVHVCAGARIGARCSFGQNVFVGNAIVIGDNCKVQNNVSLYDAVTLEDEVFCGPSMVFTNVTNPRAAVNCKDCSNANQATHSWPSSRR